MLVLLVSFARSLPGQTLNFFDIETSEYPVVKAKFFYEEDATGFPQFTKEELSIAENRTDAELLSLHFPGKNNKQDLSVVLAFDVSSSMTGERLEIAREAGRYLVESLNTSYSEAAISSFDHLNYLNCDFTKNKSKLMNALDALQPQGGTNYNSAFFMPFAGALKVAKEGKNKKVVIFLTDGRGEGEKEEIIKQANQHNITVYPVTVFLDTPELLKEVASKTGGKYYENIQSVNEARRIYREILARSVMRSYGEVVWRSPSACKKEIKIDFTFNGNTSSAVYELNDNQVSRLQAKPRFLVFKENPRDSVRRITLEAHNSDFTVNKVNVERKENYTIETNKGMPFTIGKGEYGQLILRRKKTENEPVFTHLSVENEQCPDVKVYIKDGKTGVGRSPLQVVSPNGGEVFAAGTKGSVKWKGVQKMDSVSLYFSSNNGKDWQYLKRDIDLETSWNIPAIIGDRNLIKASQGNSLGKSLTLIPLINLYGNEYNASNAQFSSRGNFIITSEEDFSIKLWNSSTGRYIQDYHFHKDWVFGVDNDWEEKLLLSFSEDGTAKVFSLNSGRGITILSNRNWGINQAIFIHRGQLVVTAGDDGMLGIWNTKTGQLVERYFSHPGWILDVAASPDDQLLVTGSDDKLVRLWNIKQKKEVFTARGHLDWVYDVDFSPEGKRFVSASKDGSFCLWDAVDKKLMNRNTEHSGKVYTANFSPDGEHIVTSSSDGTVRIWKTPSLNLQEVIRAGKDKYFRHAEFDNSGNRLLTTDSDGNVKIWLVQERQAFQEDVSDNTFSIVSPEPEFSPVDMGRQRVGRPKDSVLSKYFMNNHQLPLVIKKVEITGKHKNDFDVVSGFSGGIIEPGSGLNVELNFTPSQPGKRRARITVVTPADTIYRNLLGTGIAKTYEIPVRYVNFGKVRVAEQKDTVITVLRNTGQVPVNLRQINIEGLASSHFDIPESNLPGSITPGQEFELKIGFAPKETGRLNSVLTVHPGGSQKAEQIMLLGEGISGRQLEIYGRVLDKADNSPLTSVVRLYNLEDDDAVQKKIITKEDGKYSLKLRMNNQYRIAADKMDYIPGGIHVNLVERKYQPGIKRDIYLSKIQTGAKVRLDNVFFDFASAKLQPASFGELNKVLDFLKEHPKVNIRLEGHTDSVGTNRFNLDLSRNRANAVKKYLTQKGIEETRITTKGYGESQPVADNDDPEGRELNRRVEFIIISKD